MGETVAAGVGELDGVGGRGDAVTGVDTGMVFLGATVELEGASMYVRVTRGDGVDIFLRLLANFLKRSFTEPTSMLNKEILQQLPSINTK